MLQKKVMERLCLCAWTGRTQEVHNNCTESLSAWTGNGEPLKIPIDQLTRETKTQRDRWKSKRRSMNDKITHQSGSAGPQKQAQRMLMSFSDRSV